MKKLVNLKGVKALNRTEQQYINGSGRPSLSQPCGGTGGAANGWSQGMCFGWGIQWYNNQCWVCF